MLEDQAVGAPAPDGSAAASVPGKPPPVPAPAAGPGLLPLPDPGVADSARLRLAALRTLSGPSAADAPAGPVDDLRAIHAVLQACRGAAALPADAVDVGAGLVVLCDLRVYLDRLEADLLDAAQQAGLGWDVIAAILGIPADEAQRRHDALRTRQVSQSS